MKATTIKEKKQGLIQIQFFLTTQPKPRMCPLLLLRVISTYVCIGNVAVEPRFPDDYSKPKPQLQPWTN